MARKLSRDWTLLSKNYYQRNSPRSSPSQVQDRFWLGAAYRDTDTNHLNLLSRYEFRFEDLPGVAGLVGTRREVHTVSTHADWHPVRAWTLSGQHAAKLVQDRSESPLSRFMVQLLSGRVGYDVSSRVDLGVLASTMWSAKDGARRHAVGVEMGYQLRENMWLSVGYNMTGFWIATWWQRTRPPAAPSYGCGRSSTKACSRPSDERNPAVAAAAVTRVVAIRSLAQDSFLAPPSAPRRGRIALQLTAPPPGQARLADRGAVPAAPPNSTAASRKRHCHGLHVPASESTRSRGPLGTACEGLEPAQPLPAKSAGFVCLRTEICNPTGLQKRET